MRERQIPQVRMSFKRSSLEEVEGLALLDAMADLEEERNHHVVVVVVVFAFKA